MTLVAYAEQLARLKQRHPSEAALHMFEDAGGPLGHINAGTSARVEMGDLIALWSSEPDVSELMSIYLPYDGAESARVLQAPRG